MDGRIDRWIGSFRYKYMDEWVSVEGGGQDTVL